jgi:hypothetical protein
MRFTSETNTWSMSKAELKALLLFACKDTARVNLNVVAFLPLEGGIQATDGHVALAVSSDKWKPLCEKPVPLPFAALASVATAATVRDTIEFAFTRGGELGWTVVATWGAMRLEINPVAVTHPPLSQVWPAAIDKTGSRVVLNSTFLARVNAIALAGKSRTNPVQVYPGNTDLDPVLIIHQAEGCIWSAVLMPLRGEFTVDAVVSEAPSAAVA